MRLIDADKLKEHLEIGSVVEPMLEKGLHVVNIFIDRLPTIEAEPVKHGRWIDGAESFGAKPGEYRVCSHCNTCFPRDDKIVPPQYWQCCPNCFTRMDKEENK